jgi:hypothetical protein
MKTRSPFCLDRVGRLQLLSEFLAEGRYKIDFRSQFVVIAPGHHAGQLGAADIGRDHLQRGEILPGPTKVRGLLLEGGPVYPEEFRLPLRHGRRGAYRTPA